MKSGGTWRARLGLEAAEWEKARWAGGFEGVGRKSLGIVTGKGATDERKAIGAIGRTGCRNRKKMV